MVLHPNHRSHGVLLTATVQLLGEVCEEEVAYVLADYGREFEDFGDDPGEVQIGFGVAMYVRDVLEELGSEGYVARNDAPRAHIGQVTVVFASRR